MANENNKIMCYCTVFGFFILYFRVVSKYKPPEVYIRRGDLTEGFLSYDFFFFFWGGGGVIFGEAYFRYSKNCLRSLYRQT